MKKLIFVLMFLTSQAFASSEIAFTILKEWKYFRAEVSTLEPQGDIGGYMLYREYGEMTLLWRTSESMDDNEVIRFFMYRNDGTVFAVTYHRSDIIVPGRMVIRRFIGTEPTGWINHTVDYQTGDYLGSQGTGTELTKKEVALLKEWHITTF